MESEYASQWAIEGKSRAAVILLVLFGAALAGPAIAGPREDTLAGISRCSGIADDLSFLGCIYGATQPMRARLGLPPANPTQISLVPPASTAAARAPAPVAASKPAARKSGWFSDLFGSDTSGLRMASYGFDSHGMFTVRLSDGEVLQQSGSDINYAHWSGPAANYSVSVSVGTFGGDTLTVKGDPQSYFVQRIR